ncbi:GNAT family N-acetyltransferase [Pseudogemmatithrix spongiicola]|uniref:GNAT family N-acetyltransferase n=1 Tax=Pseudogemmatithrix spongiicola TaxID=3062599 RepID=A0AA49JXA8_9BACT|nr:GNAT family N-acetyltransferase [Gemmatimonadaceae bacterium 'strain 138']WKW16501.1 GNAT family N-acetyltransferase [Gemmatimonadaceae bacterium 'strain 318']
MSGFALRPGTAADAAAVLALNNASVPHVNELSADTLAQIVAMSAHYTVAEDAEGILGFVICIPSGRSYWSDNYNWFGERFDAFLYLDRVAVAARAQRRGIGRALYDDLHARAAERWPRIALEVNLRPPNPGSVAFHAAMGYSGVGLREYNDGDNAVEMFTKELR